MNQEAAPVIVVTEINQSVESNLDITQTEDTSHVVSSHHTISRYCKKKLSCLISAFSALV